MSERAEVIRSEEELAVTRERRPVERVRIRKVIVEEERMVPVVVRREELRVEREPLDAGAADPAPDGSDGAEELLAEIVLHSEEVEVVTRAVPRERVRVLRVRETRSQVVSAELLRERVEVEPG